MIGTKDQNDNSLKPHHKNMSLKKTVLLIDDDKSALDEISYHLKESDFAVYTAESGKEGLIILEANKIDIVILDMIMPLMDGYEVLKNIRANEKLASIPVIVLTARCSEEDKIKALDEGADDYITKPFDNNELVSRINAIFRRLEVKPKKNNRHILITGGAGFIGSHLARKLLQGGHKIFVIDDFSTGTEANIKDLIIQEDFHLIKGSITDDVLVNKYTEKSDLIYHLAATVGVKNVVENPLETLIYDTLGTELVLKYAAAKGIKVVMTSTSEVYGKSQVVPFKEDADLVLGPPHINRWSYACAKLLDEFLAMSYRKERDLPFVAVRLFNVVGPRQAGRYGMVVPRFFKNALRNAPIVIYGDGEQVRCFTYIDEVVDMLIKLADIEEAVGESINLGSRNEISIKNLALKIKDITRSSSLIVFEPYASYYGESFQDVKKRVPDLSKLERIAGSVPSINLDTILIKIRDYYQQNPMEVEVF